jgi:alpha-ketoglutarate-dependent taurine dioxygenase
MRPPIACTRVSADEATLTIEWNDGTSAEFASIWLRDNLPQDRDAYSGQRVIDVTDLPLDARIGSATLADAAVRVAWLDEVRSSMFALDWLYQQALGRDRPAVPQPQLWLEGARLEPRRDFACQPLEALQVDARVRLDWLTRLLQQGMAFLRDVPANEAGITQAMALVGRIADTNYGLVFDVRAVPQPENLAYSDVGLGLHTDNPYREPVPGFQALHTLVAAPDGGESLFADGFALAQQLRTCCPEAFALLTRTAVPFRYRSEQAELYAERPLIELSCGGAITAVHYNSRSIAPLRLAAGDCPPYYAAYRRLGEMLREPRYQLRTLLVSGDLVVFDNQRILHGRTGFASAQHPRHLRGCYLTRDSVYGEAALLQRRIGSRA